MDAWGTTRLCRTAAPAAAVAWSAQAVAVDIAWHGWTHRRSRVVMCIGAQFGWCRCKVQARWYCIICS
jgi:hypothetical protein